MKTPVAILLLSFVAFMSYGQKKEPDTAKVRLPIKDGVIFYERIIDSLDGTKIQLYNSSLKWLANSFNDSREVIQVKDLESGTIVGAGNLVLRLPGFIETNDMVSFRTEITVKDNKSRIRLYQFTSKAIGYKYDFVPMEGAYFKYLSQKKFPKENRKYYQRFEEIIDSLLSSYQTYLKTNSKPDNF